MAQNTSSAVMQQRSEPHDSLDDFPTPPWATRALIQHVLFRVGSPKWNHSCPKTVCYRVGYCGDPVAPEGRLVAPAFPIDGLTVWEPACNRGHMAKPLAEYFGAVHASDIHDYGWTGQHETSDFLFHGGASPFAEKGGPDWIITNPPFRLAEQFIAKAQQVAKTGVAIIVRTAFLEGIGRYHDLFSENPPTVIAQFSERVVMVKGRLTATGSTATAYCWLVWLTGERGVEFTWIPPCRRQLEQSGDYEPAE